MKQVEQMEAEVEELKAKLQETQQQLKAEREAEKLHREQVQEEGTAAILEKMGERSDETQGVFKAQVKKALKNILWWVLCLFLWKLCPQKFPWEMSCGNADCVSVPAQEGVLP